MSAKKVVTTSNLNQDHFQLDEDSKLINVLTPVTTKGTGNVVTNVSQVANGIEVTLGNAASGVNLYTTDASGDLVTLPNNFSTVRSIVVSSNIDPTTVYENSVVLGAGAKGRGVVIGSQSNGGNAGTETSVVIGTDSSAKDGVTIGNGSRGLAKSVVIGNSNVNTNYADSVSIGNNVTNRVDGVAVGFEANVTGTFSVAVGKKSKANHTRSVAIGYESNTRMNDQVSFSLLNTSTGLATTPKVLSGVGAPLVDQDVVNKLFLEEGATNTHALKYAAITLASSNTIPATNGITYATNNSSSTKTINIGTPTKTTGLSHIVYLMIFHSTYGTINWNNNIKWNNDEPPEFGDFKYTLFSFLRLANGNWLGSLIWEGNQ